MICLGLDLSTKPGYALIEDGVKLIKYGTMFDLQRKLEPNGLDADYDLMDRSLEVAREVVAFVRQHQVDLISIEQSNQGFGLVSMKSQEFIHFAVLQELRNAGYQDKVAYILSPTWQSLTFGKMTKEQKAHNKAVREGTARGKITKKHQAVQWANKTFGLSLLMKDEDTADAIGIAYGGWKRHVDRLSTPKPDLDKIFT